MRPSRRFTAQLLALGLSGLAACAAGPGPRGLLPEAPHQDPEAAPQGGPWPEASYLEARLQDLFDALPISFGIGPGLMASGRLGPLGTGAGLTQGIDRYGWSMNPGRWPRAGHWHEGGELGFLLSYARSTDGSGYDVLYMPVGPFPNEAGVGGLEWPMVFDAEASVHVGYLGVRAGVSPVQVLDFLVGWFGFDLVRDDQPGRARPWTRAWRARPYYSEPRAR